MSLQLMYITNKTEVAGIAEQAGVNRIWIDLEKIGKEQRQKGDTVKSDHTISDVRKMRNYLKTAELFVRVNPVHSKSHQEIDQVIEAGADIIMLPYYKTNEEVHTFLDCVAGRVRTCLLLETKEAHGCLQDTLKIPGIDEMYIGLNDLHLSYKKQFMFELLVDGTLDDIAGQLRGENMPFGFGGIARLGMGQLEAEYILAEHYRLKSSSCILSRSFCREEQYGVDAEQFKKTFTEEVAKLRNLEMTLFQKPLEYFEKNHEIVQDKIKTILEGESNDTNI